MTSDPEIMTSDEAANFLRLSRSTSPRKSNLGPLERPIGLKLTFGEAVQMEPLDLSSEPDLAAALPAKDRIKAVLKDVLKTAKEVAEETGIALATVKARLSEGKGIWSVNVGNELWGLVHRR